MSVNKIDLLNQVRGYFVGAKASIEALSGLEEGSIGYASDTNEFGSFSGSAWTWGGGGGLPSPFALTGDITPAAIGANQDNYNPAGLASADVLRLEATGAARSITGLAGGADGRILLLHNIGTSYGIYLVAESTGSSAGNRFADTLLIPPRQSALIQYDATSSRWRIFGRDASSLQGAAVDESLLSSLADGRILRWNNTSQKFESFSLFDDTEGNPAPIGTASDGSSEFAARRDHVHSSPAGAAILIPFGAYTVINPITASTEFPYSVTINETVTFVKWAQNLYVGGTNNGLSYWTISLLRWSDDSVIASVNTAASAGSAKLQLSTTSFSIASIASGDGIVVRCAKSGATGTPGSLYIQGPWLKATL